METEVRVETKTQQVEMQLVVTRCGCGHPEWHNGSPYCKCGESDGLTWHSAQGPKHVCPQPRRVDDLGTVAYFNRSRWRRLLWAVTGGPLAHLRIQLSNRR